MVPKRGNPSQIASPLVVGGQSRFPLGMSITGGTVLSAEWSYILDVL